LLPRTAAGVSSIDPAQWDACAGDGDPFLSHAFLAALEESGSVGPGTGWQASPILIDDAQGAPLGILPAYFKGHSQGEYVFDHGWADAWERAGGRYYPKLQIAVPSPP
jgi:predicted N-acyltransferase